MPDNPDTDVKTEAPVAAPAKPKRKRGDKTKPQPPKPLPLWRVLLHNDNKNEMLYVVLTIIELTPLNEYAAGQRMLEAHKKGVSLLLVTHRERAELYEEQFRSKGLKVTIEPAD